MTAIFKMDQGVLPPGTWGRARQDLQLSIIGGSIIFEAQDKAHTTYKFEVISEPPGSAVVPVNPDTDICTVDVTTEGGYLMRLTVDEGLETEDIVVLYFGIPLPNSGLCIPAFNETYFDNSQPPYTGERGYEEKLTTFLKWVDANVGSGGERKAAVLDIVDCTAPPPTENDGDRYILDNTVGVIDPGWDGGDRTNIVQYDSLLDTWNAEVPLEGWRCLVDALNTDALFVDDPPTPAYWEPQPIASNLWVLGTGISAIKRADNVTGTVAGDYAVNAGWGGTADAEGSFNGGVDCLIHADSDASVVFGYNNEIGSILRSNYSLVAGADIQLNGLTTHGFFIGSNAVFGRNQDIAAACSVVGGELNVLANVYDSAVFGSEVDYSNGGWSLIAGNGHVVSNVYHLIAGVGNTVDAWNCFVFGVDNECYSDSSGIAGSNNILGNTYLSRASFVAGENNVVDGSLSEKGKNNVFGRSNVVQTDYGTVFGYANAIYTIYTFAHGYGNAAILGSDLALFGGDNEVAEGYFSVVSGENNYVGGAYYSLITGDSNEVYSSYGVNVHGTENLIYFSSYPEVHGYNNYLDGGSYPFLFGHSLESYGSDHAVIFGIFNTIDNNPFSVILGGIYGQSRWFSQILHSGTNVAYTQAYRGESQNTLDQPLTMYTEDAVWTVLRPDGKNGSEELTLNEGSAYLFDVLIIASKKNAAAGYPKVKSWNLLVTACRDSSGVHVIGTDVIGTHATSNDDEGIWDVQAVADGDGIAFECKGSASDSDPVAWQASLRLPEITPEHAGMISI